jgi:hypothetical protein
MTPDLGNRSSAFNIVYPTNNTGVLQIENIGTVDNIDK